MCYVTYYSNNKKLSPSIALSFSKIEVRQLRPHCLILQITLYWNIRVLPYCLCLLSCCNSTGIVTETEWPTKSKIFTIWPFVRIACQPLPALRGWLRLPCMVVSAEQEYKNLLQSSGKEPTVSEPPFIRKVKPSHRLPTRHPFNLIG